MILVGDIMSDEVIVVYEDMLIRQVAHLMLRKQVTAFPVVSKKIGLVGIISMTDLFMMINKAFIKKTDDEFRKRLAMFRDMSVGDVMSRKVVTVKPTTTLDEIVDLVVRKKIHVFPVVEKKEIVGIISRHDILNAVYAYD
ncbi:MAG: CBS domain-containing protein [Candidatus Omnitrophica bacterium]|jgi:CBS domain-containing protein|nr:CBS domain-containing protein [Candidatus Omnitrophota bacterium]